MVFQRTHETFAVRMGVTGEDVAASAKLLQELKDCQEVQTRTAEMLQITTREKAEWELLEKTLLADTQNLKLQERRIKEQLEQIITVARS